MSDKLTKKQVFEVVKGQPKWSSLSKLALDNVAQITSKTVNEAVKVQGRVGCAPTIQELRRYFSLEMPPRLRQEVLEACLSRDRFRCHHNPTDCLALELWRVFYSQHLVDVNVVHHEFAFPKTSNYPEIVQNLDNLLMLMINTAKDKHLVGEFPRSEKTPSTKIATTTNHESFKLELKQCEIGFLLEDKILCSLNILGRNLKRLELPGLASDRLLDVIANHCTNLEALNVKGSREQISDEGFRNFAVKSPSNIRKLDISRCGLTQMTLITLKKIPSLIELKVSTTLLDDINYSCDGQALLMQENNSLESLPQLTQIQCITIENDSYVQVSINKVITLLRNAFPSAKNIQLVNCIACELHVTLTQHPTNITYMRETIQTLELISADYFNFPRLVYPCPNLESLCIEKPSNDVFNIDQQNVPFLYGNTVPFINLKHLKLSRISLTNLPHFLSKSNNLRKFKVTNIGRRERPRWSDQRVRQFLPPDSCPHLEEFHVSCLPNEGFSTSDTHRYLHLTKATVQYLTDNFLTLKVIEGVESWMPKEMSGLINCSELSRKNFSVTSM